MTTSGPSPAGIAELKRAAAALGHRPPAPKRRRWPHWLTGRRLVLIVVIDLVLGHYAWNYLTRSQPKAESAAVLAVANAASHHDWSGVYRRLCRSDRRQVSESQLAASGQAALLSLGGLDHLTVRATHSVTLPVGIVHWPAAQVSGQLVPVVGTPSDYTVTVIRESAGWRVCLTAGGYRSTALNVDVPLGDGQLALSGG